MNSRLIRNVIVLNTMKLTRHQRNRLVTYWLLHRKQPTRRDVLRRIAPQIAMFGALCALPIAGMCMHDPLIFHISLLTLGLVIGMAGSAISLAMMSVHMWPLIEYITDWDRVEALKRENAPNA